MRWLAHVFLLTLWPVTATAEIVPVQIGERDDATRLLLTIPPDAGWTTSALNGRLRIVIDGASGYDTSGFATVTAESRVDQAFGGLTPDVLNVGLTCDCSANGYKISDKFLAIDIVEKTIAPTILTFEDVLPSLVQPWHRPLMVSGQDADAPLPPTGPRVPADVLDSAVSNGLARATYQGFLQLRDEDLPELRSEISANLLDNIAIGVEAQLLTLVDGDEPLLTTITFGCTAVAAALSEAWDTELSFSLQRGTVHRHLVADDGETDPVRERDLALVLIGHGFGVEAESILRDLDQSDDLSRALMYMAQVLDDPIPPQPIGLETCEESLSFWAFLTDPEDSDDAIDPRRLMITYKLLPPMLQRRLVDPFADALARAGHQSFQAELQDFRNVAMAVDHDDPETPPPVLDFETPASARDILRADLTASDLDPLAQSPRNPSALPLDVLDTLRMERRDTSAEPVLLNEVLARHVAGGDYYAVVSLLIDAAKRLDDDTVADLTERHLTAAVAAMTDPELVAFAFRAELPALPETVRAGVRTRLRGLQISPPPIFDPTPSGDLSASEAALEVDRPDDPIALPSPVQLPPEGIPTFAQSQDLIDGSAAMRSMIETLINDIN